VSLLLGIQPDKRMLSYRVVGTPQSLGHASLNFPRAMCVSTRSGKYSLPFVFPGGDIQDELYEDAGALILVKFPDGECLCAHLAKYLTTGDSDARARSQNVN
jgi:hypothetical protein